MSTSPPADLIDIIRSQARVETKLDMILERIDKSDSAHETLRGRVDVLERARERQIAVIGAVGSAAGVGTGFLVPWLKAKLGL